MNQMEMNEEGQIECAGCGQWNIGLDWNLQPNRRAVESSNGIWFCHAACAIETFLDQLTEEVLPSPYG